MTKETKSVSQQNKQVTSVILIFFVTVVIFLVGFFTGKASQQYALIDNQSSTAGYQLTGDLNGGPKDVDVTLLWKVWSIINSDYLNKKQDGQKMLYGAIKGLVASLDDQYSSYLPPTDAQSYLDSNAGEFEGIGASLKQEEDYVAVESPIENSPAFKAGIKAGDIILKVDGQEMYKKSPYEAAAKIRGTAGTTVAIEILRPAENKKYNFSIVRAKIDIDNIAMEDLGNGVIKIKIYKFTENDVATFYKLWDQIVDKVLAKHPKSLIIDLRNNPGGFVEGVKYILGEFLPKDTVIMQEESRNGTKVTYKVTRTGQMLNIPMVVLVNEGSASASEIFAGAIQDHNRGKIIGAKTVGKGVEQEQKVFDDGSILHLVFQKWLRPSGKQITKDEPITPDFLIEDYAEQDKKALEIVK